MSEGGVTPENLNPYNHQTQECNGFLTKRSFLTRNHDRIDKIIGRANVAFWGIASVATVVNMAEGDSKMAMRTGISAATIVAVDTLRRVQSTEWKQQEQKIQQHNEEFNHKQEE